MDTVAALLIAWITMIWTLNIHNAVLAKNEKLNSKICCVVEKEDSWE